MAVRESCEPSMLPVDDSLVKGARKGGRNSCWTPHQLYTVWRAMWQQGSVFWVFFRAWHWTPNDRQWGKYENVTDITLSTQIQLAFFPSVTPQFSSLVNSGWNILPRKCRNKAKKNISHHLYSQESPLALHLLMRCSHVQSKCHWMSRVFLDY